MWQQRRDHPGVKRMRGSHIEFRQISGGECGIDDQAAAQGCNLCRQNLALCVRQYLHERAVARYHQNAQRIVVLHESNHRFMPAQQWLASRIHVGQWHFLAPGKRSEGGIGGGNLSVQRRHAPLQCRDLRYDRHGIGLVHHIAAQAGQRDLFDALRLDQRPDLWIADAASRGGLPGNCGQTGSGFV